MSPDDVETLLQGPGGYRSDAVARFVWQIDEQRRALLDDVRGLAVEDLGWQAAPGVNTIGMLLAHIAYAEAHLTQVGLQGEAVGHAHDVIGIREQDEGLPLPPGGRPPAALQDRDLAFYLDALERARTRTREVARTLSDDDLERRIVRPRPDGRRRVFNVGWVFYHLIEHEAGHRAQVNLLRHLRSALAG